MLGILRIVERIADTISTVLIQGESGTGKELIARALHAKSSRQGQGFVSLNCGAFSEHLVESELFGHVRGAFTGAVSDKSGWFLSADGGTIFLDEVSEMTPSLQVKLLRVLQTGEFSPVGSTDVLQTSARVIAATNQDLRKLVSMSRFRQDLFYRLDVIEINLPPLRERLGDLPLLIAHFIEFYKHKFFKPELTVASDARSLLLGYPFPGNIRELRNIIERGAALTEDGKITVELLPKYVHQAITIPGGGKSKLADVKQSAADEAERQYVTECLRATRGHITNAARLADVDTSNFHKLVKKHGIDVDTFKD